LLNPLGSLSNLLLQIGLTDSSPSFVAVLNGLLAISALHAFGEGRAIRFKSRAISMTRISLDPDNPDSVIIGNLAASMLLYLYEVSITALHVYQLLNDETLYMSTPVAWAAYLFGVKQILQFSKERGSLSKCYRVIFEWILYHETIIEFSQLYYGRETYKPLCRTRISGDFICKDEPRNGNVS
jgi:hypothetical protein